MDRNSIPPFRHFRHQALEVVIYTGCPPALSITRTVSHVVSASMECTLTGIGTETRTEMGMEARTGADMEAEGGRNHQECALALVALINS